MEIIAKMLKSVLADGKVTITAEEFHDLKVEWDSRSMSYDRVKEVCTSYNSFKSDKQVRPCKKNFDEWWRLHGKDINSKKQPCKDGIIKSEIFNVHLYLHQEDYNIAALQARDTALEYFFGDFSGDSKHIKEFPVESSQLMIHLKDDKISGSAVFQSHHYTFETWLERCPNA